MSLSSAWWAETDLGTVVVQVNLTFTKKKFDLRGGGRGREIEREGREIEREGRRSINLLFSLSIHLILVYGLPGDGT